MDKAIKEKQGSELAAEGMKLTSMVTALAMCITLGIDSQNFFPFWGKPSLSFFFMFLSLIFALNFILLKLKVKKKKAGKKGGFDIWGELSQKEINRLSLAVFFCFAIIGPLTIFMNHTIRNISVLQVVLTTFFSGMLSASIILFGKRKYLLVASLFCSALCIRYSSKIEELIGGYSVSERFIFPDQVILTAERLRDLQNSQVWLGVFTICLLVTGYVLFIIVIGGIGKKKNRLETEIHVAAKLQSMVNMPTHMAASGVVIQSRTLPTTDVAGDYIDCFEISKSEFLAVIGDASGHGIGAGILAAMAKSAIKTAIQHREDLPGILESINNTLFDIVGREKFMTMGLVLCNTGSKTIEIATAGHPPVILHGNGVQSLVRTPSLGLGLKKNAKYTSITTSYNCGDSLVLYTDGITEATNMHGEEYGTERLEKLLEKFTDADGNFCDLLVADVTDFVAGKTLADDLSIMHIRFV